MRGQCSRPLYLMREDDAWSSFLFLLSLRLSMVRDDSEATTFVFGVIETGRTTALT